MERESEKELTKEGFERLLTKAAQPIRKQPSPEVECRLLHQAEEFCINRDFWCKAG